MQCISDNGQVYALYLDNSPMGDKTTFFTADDANFQLGCLIYPAGHKFRPHLHLNQVRTISGTQEFLWLKKGKLLVEIYNNDIVLIRELILNAGEAILLIQGGHGFTVLEEIELIEVKQGPYLQGKDKIWFDNSSPKRKNSADVAI